MASCLIPAIVASDSFNLAIPNAFVRLDFDKFLNDHSNGDVSKFWSVCSHVR